MQYGDLAHELPGWFSGKESACNAGDARDAGSIPCWENHLEEGLATHSSILSWRILWTEEPGRPQSMGSQKSQIKLSTHTILTLN